MKWPISPDSPEDKLAKAIAHDLVIEGIDGMLALPLAIKLMGIIDDAHDDPLSGIKEIEERRKETDEWWMTYHPRTKHARDARKRLKAKLASE